MEMGDLIPTVKIELKADLTDTSTLLAEKCTNAVGVLWEPIQRTRLAKADAKIAMIKLTSDFERAELTQRALDRLAHQETRKQHNIEAIAIPAINDLPEDANVKDLDDDWVAYFFESCCTFSDEAMQSMWSTMLKVEATTPGSFSKRTIDFVRTMSKDEAQLITSLRQFIWVIDGENVLMTVDHHKLKAYTTHRLSDVNLKHLVTIGLLAEVLNNNETIRFEKNAVRTSYFDGVVDVAFEGKRRSIRRGYKLLTEVGKELVPICSATPNQEFFEFVVVSMSKDGTVTNDVAPTMSSP